MKLKHCHTINELVAVLNATALHINDNNQENATRAEQLLRVRNLALDRLEKILASAVDQAA